MNVKTHTSGRVRFVEQNLIKLAEYESSTIRQAQTVVLNVCTNNVSDADQSVAIADDMHELQQVLHSSLTSSRMNSIRLDIPALRCQG